MVRRRSWPTLKVCGVSRSVAIVEGTNSQLVFSHEDSNAPTFANLINGQVNLHDAIRRQIDFETGGKSYKLSPNPAVLIVR